MSVVVVGAGPAGTRAAQILVEAGLRPVVIDEGAASGGRIVPRHTHIAGEQKRASALHGAFDVIAPHIDYRPNTAVWDLQPDCLHTASHGPASTRVSDGMQSVRFEHAILCTGAVDRTIPLPGWTLPGVFSVGGAQLALKMHGCAIGQRVVFLGTGPLLWRAAAQYRRAGANVVAVLDTTSFLTKAAEAWDLMLNMRLFVSGLTDMTGLRRRSRVEEGVTPLAIEGDGSVRQVRWQRAGKEFSIACDAVAMGWGLQPETQLADLAGVPFAYDAADQMWLPVRATSGRTPIPSVFMGGDGTRIAGADVAELAGARAAWAVLEERRLDVSEDRVVELERAMYRQARFRQALDRAFPFPMHLAAGMADDTILCRCETVTAGALRAVAADSKDVNRAKSLCRVGMGRCQGRFCGHAAAAVLSAARDRPLQEAGRLRAQAPIKPISLPLPA